MFFQKLLILDVFGNHLDSIDYLTGEVNLNSTVTLANGRFSSGSFVHRWIRFVIMIIVQLFVKYTIITFCKDL